MVRCISCGGWTVIMRLAGLRLSALSLLYFALQATVVWDFHVLRAARTVAETVRRIGAAVVRGAGGTGGAQFAGLPGV